ncbi:MAG: tRNA-dihydrouridine synthase family protein [Gammaproteobacteria bacterium]|nr:tRNA-dihydrouridine synthase family protein [Gammaproteobacteria bacterium]
MIKPLQLGKQIFPVNLIQGPLAGVSCAPFRLLTWRYSKPAYTCTEMISCKTILHSSDLIKKRYITKYADEGPVCFQLSGSEVSELAAASQLVTSYGANLIDLNCGCPAGKIRRKGAGSKHLSNASHLYQLIRAMKQNTHVPVSIKIRVDGYSTENFNHELIHAIQDAGTDFVVVHGRHWTEKYNVPCHYDQIQYFVNELSIPVIGNGDIANDETLLTMMKLGCNGAMVGRASVGQPWLIGQLIATSQHLEFSIPSLSDTGKIFLEHVAMLIELLDNEKHALLQARKIAKYYARSIKYRNEFCESVNHCFTFENLQEICCHYFN